MGGVLFWGVLEEGGWVGMRDVRLAENAAGVHEMDGFDGYYYY